MGKTKKVHSTGRFGSRYGVGIRKRILKVEMQQKEKQKCSVCGLGTLKRKAAGVFVCSKCERRFAGGAYFFETMTGSLIKKMVSQKKFSAELLEMQEPQAELPIEEKKEEPKKEKLLDKAKLVLGIKKTENKK
jgi:large subunit ribosomal protein L37Ae